MFKNNILEILSELATLFPAFLIIFTGRGFFKAWSAKLMGDDTAKDNGFLTINPLVHINFYGFISFLFIFLFIGELLAGHIPRSFLFIFIFLIGVRWVIPVPINEHNFKNYRLGVVITTLAGSISSFLITLFFMYVFVYFPRSWFPNYVNISIQNMISVTINFSVWFAVLNLIPMPPFDGGRLLKIILPNELQDVVDWLEKYSRIILLVVFFIPILSDYFFGMISLVVFLIKRFLLGLVI